MPTSRKWISLLFLFTSVSFFSSFASFAFVVQSSYFNTMPVLAVIATPLSLFFYKDTTLDELRRQCLCLLSMPFSDPRNSPQTQRGAEERATERADPRVECHWLPVTASTAKPMGLAFMWLHVWPKLKPRRRRYESGLNSDFISISVTSAEMSEWVE